MKQIKPLLWALLVISSLFCGRALYAQQIQWLPLPINTSTGDPLLGPNPSGSNPAGTWIVTNLACYGDVLVTQTFPGQPDDFSNPNFQNVPNPNATFINGGTNSSFSWGPLGELNTVNTVSSTEVVFTINFYFLSGQPNFSGVVLMSAGLAEDTTAALSQPVVFRGEVELSSSAHTCLTNHTYNPALTTGSTNVGTIGNVVGSYYNTDHHGDNFNTGLALFQPIGELQTTTLPTGSAGFPTSSSPVPYLTLTVSQQPGDGIGFNLGYICSTNGCTNSCITIVDPENVVASTCSNCAVVSYQAQVTDSCCSNLAVTYKPPSGTCFPPGTNTVQVIATDACGNSNNCSFTVIVSQDTNTPIILSCPTGITNCFASGCGPMPDDTGEVEAMGSVPGASVSITQSIPPGTIICTNTNVTFTVTSACGSSTNITVPVILTDNCCLQIACPDGISEETCSNSLPIFFTVPFQDTCCSRCNPTLVSTPPSGFNFPVGTTIVTNIVTDTAGNSNGCIFNVTVLQDPNCSTNCLQLNCWTNVVVFSCTNIPVDYFPTATDNCCSNWSVVCNPLSGSSFAPNTTNTVVVTATDSCSDSNTCSFTVTVLCSTNPCPCNGQNGTGAPAFDDLFNFGGSTSTVNPYTGVVVSPDGATLYCTTTAGNQSVFAVDISSGAFSDLHDFVNNNGGALNTAGPGVAAPTLSTDGKTLYGTADRGGTFGWGTIWSIDLGTGTFTVLYNFTGTTSDGANPVGTMALSSDGHILYGTTSQGGSGTGSGGDPWGSGTVFAFDIPSGVLTTLYNFTPLVGNISNGDGAAPWGGVTLSADQTTIYGAATAGGTYGSGTIFKINLNNNQFTVLYTFTQLFSNNSDGADPHCGLVLSADGITLYGDAVAGGTYNEGTLFSFNINTAQFTTLYDFTAIPNNFPFINADGAQPQGTLALSSDGGILYGTASFGGSSGSGTIYAFNLAGQAFTVLHSFGSKNDPDNGGMYPCGALTLSSDGSTLYGAALDGGINGVPSGGADGGTIFSLALTNSSTNCFQVQCPTNIVASSCTNVQEFYSPIVIDLACTNWNAVCTPPSGFFFAPNTTNVVACVVTDCCGNSNYCTFTVTVFQGTNCTNCLPPVFGCASPSVEFVPNGDFESYTSCPTAGSDLNLAVPWFQPTAGTPEYFNTCAPASSGVSVPNNFIGSVAPHSGNGYAGAYEYYGGFGGNIREYLEVPLSAPMQANVTYGVSFYVSLASSSGWAINNLDAYFSTGPLLNNGSYDPFNVLPQVQNPSNVFLNSVGSWMLVSGTYTAVGGENYLTIGNFNTDALTVRMPVGDPNSTVAYYYLDDVSVTNLCACPPDKTVEATTPWTFDTPTAYDPNTGVSINVTILSTVTNGNCPLTITQTWLATNSCGTNTCSQTVTVLEAPQILSTNITVSSCVSTQVFYAPTATDSCCANVLVGCNPPSGSIFPTGITTVSCTATNCFGVIATSTFTVTVGSTPVFPVQTNIVVMSCTNLPVSYNLTFTNDPCCSNWVIGFSIPSGSTFDVGTTTTVSYSVGNTCLGTNNATFTVTVLPGTNCTPCLVPVFGCLTSSGNLVPNGDFETYTNCPSTLSEIYLAAPWFQPTSGTSDYFNACASSSSGVSTPNNLLGSVVPHSGNGYAGLLAFTGAIEFEYIEVPLTQPLVAGQTYQVSFYVSLADSAFAIDSLGAYFSVGPTLGTTWSALLDVPQVRNTPGVFLTSIGSWTLISGTFTAAGGENYMTIGNFNDDAHTLYTPSGATHLNGNPGGYYYVDDVSVSNQCGCPANKVVYGNSPWSFDTPQAYDPNTGASVNVTVLSTVTNVICPLTITQIWAATNSCGTNTCSQTVTVLEAPQILSTNITFFSCVSTNVFFAPSATDSCCSDVLVGCDPPSGSMFSPGTSTVVCRATNCYGIIASSTFTVTLLEASVSQTNIVVTSCTNLPVYYNPTVVDCSICSNRTLSVSPLSGSTFDVGTTSTVTYALTDSCGDTNTGIFTVTVLPSGGPPVFGCPTSPVNLVPNGDFESFTSCPDNNSELNLAFPWFQPGGGTPDYFNSCGLYVGTFGSIVPHSGNGYAGGFQYYSGGGSVLNVSDDREYIEVPLSSPLKANVTYGVSLYVSLASSAGFGINSMGAYFSVGPLVNYSSYEPFNVVPQVQNPSSVFLDSVGTWMLISGTYTAAGGEDHLTIGNFKRDLLTLATPSPSPAGGEINECYYYFDDVSVTNMCGCPPDKTVEGDTLWSFDTPSAYDPATGAGVNVTVLSTVTNGNCPLTITQTWVAINGCGSNTCSQTVTVLEAPQIVSTNITVSSCVSTQVFYAPTAVDSCCGNVAVGCNPPSGSIFPPGTTTVRCTATNCFGVIAASTFTVMVVDSSVSQTNIVVTSCTKLPVDYNPTVTDCCSSWHLSVSPHSGSTFDVGTTNTVTYTVTDSCGYTNVGTFTVTVLPDTNCLQVQCPTNLFASTCSNCAVVKFAASASNPFCNNGPITLTYSPLQPGSCFPVGTTMEQVTAEDSCSDTATCYFNVTVTQNSCPPIISVGPTNFVLCAGASGCVPMPDEVHPTPNFFVLKNTGVSSNLSASGTFALPESTLNDPHWTLVSVPALPPASPLEFGTNTQLQINSLPQWLSPDPLAAWIAPANDASNDAPEGDYDYQTTFVLPADGAFTISAQVAADDYVSDVLLNGGSIGLSTTNGNSATQWNPITITGQGFAGTNTLDFIVHNNPTIGTNPPADNTDSPSGLLVEFNAITIATTQLQPPPPPFNPAAVQATNCDGSAASGWQSIPPNTILCGDTNITFVFTNECGDTTSYTATVIVENCCVAPPNNMVLWLTFDETVGDTCLNSVGGNNGVRYFGPVIAKSNNGPSHNVGEYVNNSLCFNGIDDSVLVPDYPAIDFPKTNFSIDAWVKWNGAGSSLQVLVDHRSQAGPNIYGYEWFLNNGKPGLQLATGPFTNYVSAHAIPAGVWTHLAVTVQRNSASGVKFYVNGSLTDFFNDIPVAGSIAVKPIQYLAVGNLSPVFTASSPFDGCMDELELFSRPLLIYEVQDIYGAFHAGKCRPTCSVPPVTSVCLGSATVTVPVEVCNTGSTTQNLHVSFVGLSAAQAGGPPAVNGPGAGQFSGYPTVVTLPPNTCSNFTVTIVLPAGLNLSTVAYYQMTIMEYSTGQSFSSIGALREIDPFWCNNHIHIQNGANLVISTGPVNFGFMVNNPTNVPYPPLNSEVLVVDGNLNPETNVVSLNGLAPGTPATNQFVIPANGSIPVTVNVSYLDSQPSTPYYLLLYLNIPYDGVPIPVASAGFAQTIPPTVGPPVSASYANGQATITWDAVNTGWTLLSNTNIANTNWIPVNLPVLPQLDGSQGVTLPAAGNTQFFQLVKPVPP